MKKLVSALIAVSILTFCFIGSSFAEEFVLRNGILFSDSLSTVKEKEKLELKDTTDEDDGKCLEYEGTVASYKGTVEYFFDSTESLTEMCYNISESRTKSASHESIFESLKSSITNKYGEPLGNSNGNTHPILGKAFEESIGMCQFVRSFMGKKADLVSYEEWFIECDGGAVKIDLVDYYFVNAGNSKEYHILLSYHFSSTDEISALVQENQEKKDAINNDI